MIRLRPTAGLRTGQWSMGLCSLLLAAACAPAAPSGTPAMLPAHGTPWQWDLPQGMAAPRVPASNPMTVEKVALGRRLFYEKRLSVTGAFSCASCHDQALGFTDGKATAVGATGMPHPRNSMGLMNVAYASVLTWGNPLMVDLETQAVVPLVGDQPIEIGFGAQPGVVRGLLQADADYAGRFRACFPEEAEPISLGTIAKALASFQRAMVSFESPYDRAQRGDPLAMSIAARRGADLFFGERLECAHCHDGPHFTDSAMTAASSQREVNYHNTGLFNLGGTGAYPEGGTGVYEVTRRPNDMGQFKAPSLRNVGVTGPYFHDGSAATLADVLDHYRAGGRTISSGPHAGIGAKNPLKDTLIAGFVLNDVEKADVLAFLDSLTDRTFLTNPAFASPFGDRQPPQ